MAIIWLGFPLLLSLFMVCAWVAYERTIPWKYITCVAIFAMLFIWGV